MPQTVPQAERVLPQSMTPAITPVFAEYKPPANGVTYGIAFGHDNAVWFTQHNSYVGRYNGSFSSVHVNLPQPVFVQNGTKPILAALSSGVYGGVEYYESGGFYAQENIYKITYAHTVSTTSGSEQALQGSTMQAIAAGTSDVYATGSYIELGPPGCNSCLYVISNTGASAVRTQNYEAGEAIAYIGGYLYVAAAQNYGNGAQHGVRIYKINATTLSGFSLVASLSAPSNINFMTEGPDGALWFTDNGRNAIGRYAPGSLHEYTIPTANAQPVGIARGLDGALWFAEAQVNRIGRITTTGAITQYNLPFAGGHPTGLVAAPTTHTLWFTDTGTGKIGRVLY
ncbi:MAG: hypothetical protein JO165_10885 [Candidatus Eremiobacteraeota bacterium]|nr:hypothetical protein [Candidatus Eremiobacteraeota bacterium]